MRIIVVVSSLCIFLISFTIFASDSGTYQWFNVQVELLLKSDGNDAEELDVSIGKMIKTHPTNFLKSLLKYEKKVQRLDAVLGNLGFEYVDQDMKSREEFKKRKLSIQKAISKTNDKEIKRVGLRCINQLDQFLKQ